MDHYINSGSRKVVIVGAGAVGATYCYSLSQSGLADEIVIIDKTPTWQRVRSPTLFTDNPSSLP